MKRFNLLVYVYRGINTLEEKFTRKNHPDYKSDEVKAKTIDNKSNKKKQK